MASRSSIATSTSERDDSFGALEKKAFILETHVELSLVFGESNVWMYLNMSHYSMLTAWRNPRVWRSLIDLFGETLSSTGVLLFELPVAINLDGELPKSLLQSGTKSHICGRLARHCDTKERQVLTSGGMS